MIEWLASGFHYAWSFVVVLSVIVFIHEFGHYIIAKWCGVKVETFSIGFGKELFGFHDRSGTRWKISALPFGGYVKMFGDEGAASTPDHDQIATMSEQDQARSFFFKPLWQKAAIVVAGPVANFALTIAIFTYFLYSSGLSSTDPIVGEIMPDTPAMEAGLQAGDHIIAVDGEPMKRFQDIALKIATNLGTTVELTIDRDGETQILQLTPMEYEDDDGFGNKITRPLIGIKSHKMTVQDLSFAQAVWEATRRTYQLCETTVRFMKQMVTGQRSADELKGPLGIAKLSGQATQQGDTTDETFRTILWFIAMLSANLGFINLLPIPMLDGGHLAYYGVEALRGKPMAQKFQEFGFRFGFAFILCLMVFTLYNDIKQIFL